MPDYVITATQSVRFIIDNNNSESDRKFVIDHHGGGAGDTRFTVEESGQATVFGEIKRGGTPPEFNNTASNGDIVAFKSAGTLKAKVDGAGKGVLMGGVRIRIDTGANDPNTAGLAGVTGELVLWYNSGTSRYEIWACTDGATPTWNRATTNP